MALVCVKHRSFEDLKEVELVVVKCLIGFLSILIWVHVSQFRLLIFLVSYVLHLTLITNLAKTTHRREKLLLQREARSELFFDRIRHTRSVKRQTREEKPQTTSTRMLD